MVDRTYPNRITWAIISIGEEDTEWRDAVMKAMPGVKYFVWPDPPQLAGSPFAPLIVSPSTVLVFRNGKLVRPIDIAHLPVLIQRL